MALSYSTKLYHDTFITRVLKKLLPSWCFNIGQHVLVGIDVADVQNTSRAGFTTRLAIKADTKKLLEIHDNPSMFSNYFDTGLVGIFTEKQEKHEEGTQSVSMAWYTMGPGIYLLNDSYTYGGIVWHMRETTAFGHNVKTRPEARGMGIVALTLSQAGRILANMGVRFQTGAIDSMNDSSLRAHEKMHYRVFCLVTYVRLLGIGFFALQNSDRVERRISLSRSRHVYVSGLEASFDQDL